MFAYDALKRAIRDKEAKIEDIWEQYRAIVDHDAQAGGYPA